MKGIILAGAIVGIAGLFGLIGTADEDVAKQSKEPTTQMSVEEKEESDKYIEGIEFVPMKVNGDPSGNWRVSVISEDIEIPQFALEYYEKYFKSDEEVHGIVNYLYDSTIRINKMGDLLFISVHERVDSEEWDASKLFSGERVSEYQIDVNTGEWIEVL